VGMWRKEDRSGSVRGVRWMGESLLFAFLSSSTVVLSRLASGITPPVTPTQIHTLSHPST